MPLGRRSLRGSWLAALLATCGSFAALAMPAPAMAQQTDLAWSSIGIWTADPAAHEVHVDLQIVAVSHAQSQDGRNYFYSNLNITVPQSTADYAAADRQGNALPITVIARNSSGVVLQVGFRKRLYSDQVFSFGLKFNLVDSGGSPDRDLRIGQDLIQFPVQVFGSPGTPGSSVTVIFPAAFTVQEPVGDLTGGKGDSGTTVYSLSDIPDPAAVYAWFTAARAVPPNGYRTTVLKLGPMSVTLQYWADDSSWLQQVTRVLVTGYPILRNMIGLGDPALTSLTVIEMVSAGIGGFSGDYNQAASLIRVSYFADPTVILHELAHLWLNPDLTSELWISEGFATYYAEQTVERMGLPDHVPVLSPALMLSAMPLNDWSGTEEPGTAEEAYLYAASLRVASSIAAKAGLDSLRQVWADAEAGKLPFASPGEETPSGGRLSSAGRLLVADGSSKADHPLDWKSFLDSLEATTGQSYTAIWQEWVATPGQQSLLDARQRAWTQYSSVRAKAGGWAMPPDVREQMAGWSFQSALALLSQSRDVLEERSKIETVAAAEKVALPSTLRHEFETIGSGQAWAEAESELAAIDAIQAADLARVANEGAARLVGLIGTDPDSVLARAKTAFSEGDMGTATSLADQAREAWTGARGVGQLRIVGIITAGAGMLLLVAVMVLLRSLRRPKSETEPVLGPDADSASTDRAGAVDA